MKPFQFQWKEEVKQDTNENQLEVSLIRIVDTPLGEEIELYNKKGFIVGGATISNEKEKTNYLKMLQTNYPYATLEEKGFYELEIDECKSEIVELYSFFPKQLATLIEKNLYDIYETYIPVQILLKLNRNDYDGSPVDFHFVEEEMNDTTILKQVRKDYWGEHQRNDEIFENIMQDITGKKFFKAEIDEDFGFHQDPKDWTNDGSTAYGYQAKVNLYVK